MIQYICSVGNPEGTDWSLILEHEKKFTREDFQDICEEAIAQALDEEYAERGCSFVCSIDTDKVFEKLQKWGFQLPSAEQVQYYLEPYFGREQIKSKRLLTAIDRKDKDDV
jgi:hypothetical protein